MFAHFFHCLSPQEEVQIHLYGLHSKLQFENEQKVAAIKAEVSVKWPATLRRIDEMIANKKAGKVVIYG